MKSDDFEVINFIEKDFLGPLRTLLREKNWYVFEFDGESIEDKASFLAKAAEQLPEEHGLYANNWDAFIDTLWGGLADLGETQVAFVWTDADVMLRQALPDLLIAVDCFQSLASGISNIEQGFPKPMKLRVFLVGINDDLRALMRDVRRERP